MPATIVITEYLVLFGSCIVDAWVAVTTEEHLIIVSTNANHYCFFVFALRCFETENCAIPTIANFFAFLLELIRVTFQSIRIEFILNSATL